MHSRFGRGQTREGAQEAAHPGRWRRHTPTYQAFQGKAPPPFLLIVYPTDF